MPVNLRDAPVLAELSAAEGAAKLSMRSLGNEGAARLAPVLRGHATLAQLDNLPIV